MAKKGHKCVFQPTEMPIYNERVKGKCKICGKKMTGHYR